MHGLRPGAGVLPLPGGRIHEVPGWVVEHCVGPLGLGTVIAKPARHVLHVADLDDAESAALGPLLRATSAAVAAVVPCDQVYVSLWSHAGGVPGHIHFVVQPITAETVSRFGTRGPDLQAAMFHDGTVPPIGDVERVSDQLRAEFTTP